MDDESNTVEVVSKKRKLGLDFEESDDEEEEYDVIKHELDGYQHGVSLGFEEDPLEWWRSKRGRFPHLARLAR